VPPVAAAPAPAPSASRLPHDVRPGAAASLAPLTSGRLGALVAAPLLWVFGYGIALLVAYRRRTDPRRPRREAFAHLPPAIAKVGAASSVPERIAALMEWQRTAAV